MKNILRMSPLVALMLTGVTLSAQAAMPPSNVGDVTLYGHITANSPMWQWTVNDYPGGRLDAKPSTAETAQGKVSYPLNGKWFIAASGYLPSFVGGKIGLSTTSIGGVDITTLSSPDGPLTLSTEANPATVSLPAIGTDTAGRAITGTLTLAADEIRGNIHKYISANGTHTAYAYHFSGTTKYPATATGSCWVGRPSAPVANYSRTMTATDLPVFTDVGPSATSGAVTQFNAMLAAADAAGTVRWANVPATTMNSSVTYTGSCSVASPGSSITLSTTSSVSYPYRSAAHVLALQPQTVSFPVAATGAWNATLTVTAYQM